jgi:hypothetical protein
MKNPGLRFKSSTYNPDKKWTQENWPTATNSGPHKCEDCGERLEKARCKFEVLIEPCKEFPNGLISSSSSQWRIDCKCGVCYIWSGDYGGNVWLKTHRTMELLMHKYPSGILLRPLNVKI